MSTGSPGPRLAPLRDPGQDRRELWRNTGRAAGRNKVQITGRNTGPDAGTGRPSVLAVIDLILFLLFLVAAVAMLAYAWYDPISFIVYMVAIRLLVSLIRLFWLFIR